jgi:hypothetical protein
MRILLDECLPKDFGVELHGHTVKTVPEAGWASVKNGKLLRPISDSAKFDLFVTVDQNLPRQQKLDGIPFAIVVLRAKSNRIASPISKSSRRNYCAVWPNSKPGKRIFFDRLVSGANARFHPSPTGTLG